MMIELTARDGHRLDGWLERPAGTPRGGVVIAQEMYGLTDYLKDTCVFYASHGYLTVAPALYDRRQRGFVLSYTPADHDLAQSIYTKWDWDTALDDLDAGKAAVASAGKVGIVGFCWGGSLAWLAACRRDYAASAPWYGSKMPDFAHEMPRCPVHAQVGDEDTTMPPERMALFFKARPEVPVTMHPGAKHGFDNAIRPGRWHEAASKRARAETLELLRRHVG